MQFVTFHFLLNAGLFASHKWMVAVLDMTAGKSACNVIYHCAIASLKQSPFHVIAVRPDEDRRTVAGSNPVSTMSLQPPGHAPTKASDYRRAYPTPDLTR